MRSASPKRMRRGLAVTLFVAGCALPPLPGAPQPLPTLERDGIYSPGGPEPRPTLELDDTYNTRIADLRTMLGRAGIRLRTGGIEDVFLTSGCEEPSLRDTHFCIRCELAGEHTRVDGAVIEAATRAFKLYPTDVLVASGIAQVAVCRGIVYPDARAEPAGLADGGSRGMLINLASFIDRLYRPSIGQTIDDITHHEFFHLLEYQHMRAEMSDDPQWHLHNPLGFAYDKQQPEVVLPGFVNTYAMTSAVEDRASVFEYLMSRPDELCERARTEELLRIKTRIIWQRVARVVGDRFLRRRAPCVDWID